MNKVYFLERFLYRKYASITRRGGDAENSVSIN